MIHKLTYLTLIMATLSSCGNMGSRPKAKEYSEPRLDVTAGVLTPELMWKMGRVGSPAVSPDGTRVAFTISRTDIARNKTYADIYLLPLDSAGAVPELVLRNDRPKAQIGWRPDGNALTFISTDKNDMQLFELPLDGGEPVRITALDGGIKGYAYAPTGNGLMVVSRIKLDQTVSDLYPDLPKANARIEDDLMYRHWDRWADYRYSHVMVARYRTGEPVAEFTDVMKGERFHSPLMPFGGVEQIAWTPNGRSLAYTCKKLTGAASAFSTNSDIYLYDIHTATTVNLTEGMMGYDINPTFSADGRTMFWQSMERDGYEADKNRLMALDLQTRAVTDLTAAFDENVDSYMLDPDGRTIWFISDRRAKDQIFRLDIATDTISQLTADVCNYMTLSDAGSRIVAMRQSMSHPGDLFVVDKATGESRNITNVNARTLDAIKMGRVEERTVRTTDGRDMLVWVVYPPHFDPSGTYPALLYCQGGPQSTVSQFWSLRWNMQLMAANGYIVVAPNRRGLPGFGREWNEQISGDYGGQNMKDYLSAIDAVAAEPYVDADRLGAVGASYGGFSVYWLAGHHQKRFKAFISHCGIFNFEQMYSTTEESFFVNWDLKGSYWDTDNAAAQKSYAESPHRFVRQWDTPILVIHGEKDFRIPYTQGMAAFNTAVMRGIPARFLYFPDECHWVSTPQNSILWHREFYRWLDQWLKK